MSPEQGRVLKLKCARNYRFKQRTLIRALLCKLRKEGKCADCGKNPHSSCMEFHHRNGVNGGRRVGTGLKRVSKVLLAIDKCDLLCANCHRIREYKLKK